MAATDVDDKWSTHIASLLQPPTPTQVQACFVLELAFLAQLLLKDL